MPSLALTKPKTYRFLSTFFRGEASIFDVCCLFPKFFKTLLLKINPSKRKHRAATMKINVFLNLLGLFVAFIFFGCSNQAPSPLAKYAFDLIWDYPHRLAGAEGNALFAHADSLKYERDYDDAVMAFSKLLDQGLENDKDKWYAMNQLA